VTPLFDTPTAPAEKFHPFSVLRADVGKWQDRKRAWNNLGFNSRAGREHTTTWNSTGGDDVSQKLHKISNGLSTFDPVLTELSYDWYAPANGRILDPFAGGSVRGLVAGHGGYHYTGVDLSQKQVDANRPQIEDWRERGLIDTTTTVEYIVGDAADVTPTLPTSGYDYVFTCPPYHNLEVYSDLPEDLSNMAWGDFEDAYTHIIAETIRALRPNRFATWVVGEVRDYRGMIRGLAPLTIAAHEAAGARLYNDAVLMTALGTVAMRVGNQWRASRKMGRHHQYVLTFVKGDPKEATRAAEG
jgi:16S rRNA G966 N2-methylase RsmD